MDGVTKTATQFVLANCRAVSRGQGVHPKTVQELLGHSQITLTIDTYSTVLPSVSREAASKMDALLRA